MARRVGWFLLVTVLAAAPGCVTHRMVRGTGAVHRMTTEGGFWVIQSDDGTTYDPIESLSPEFQTEGLRVKFEGEFKPDVVSTHMAGTMIQIGKIQRLE
jgi:hypothetical protein